MTTAAGPGPTRRRIALAFSTVEDVVYVGLGVLLASGAIFLLVTTAISFGTSLFAGTLPKDFIALLDRILLILLVVELLYTVQVSFREHVITPEPFLLVGLIAATRRVLILTAEFGRMENTAPATINFFLLELSVLTVLIMAIAISLFVLRKKGPVAPVKA
jgi:uncharacterized membrane protein (DUF373 family)